MTDYVGPQINTPLPDETVHYKFLQYSSCKYNFIIPEVQQVSHVRLFGMLEWIIAG